MADKTTIIYTAHNPNTDKNVQRSIPYVNPDASSADMAQLANAINSLSINTYVGAKRVDQTDISLNKTTPTIILSNQPDGSAPTTFATVGENFSVYLYVVTNSNGKPYVKSCTAYAAASIIREVGTGYDMYVLWSSKKDPAEIWEDTTATFYDAAGNTLSKTGYVDSQEPTDATAKIVVAIPETDSFNEAEVTLYIKYA